MFIQAPLCSSRHCCCQSNSKQFAIILGRAFARDIHSISESHKDNIKKKIGILTIAKVIFDWLFLPTAINHSGDVMRFQKKYFVTSCFYKTERQLN